MEDGAEVSDTWENLGELMTADDLIDNLDKAAMLTGLQNVTMPTAQQLRVKRPQVCLLLSSLLYNVSSKELWSRLRILDTWLIQTTAIQARPVLAD